MIVQKSEGVVIEEFSTVDEAGSFSSEELSFIDIPEDTKVIILCTVVKPWRDGELDDIREDDAYVVYIPAINDALMVNEKLIRKIKENEV